jgi:DNA-binding NarL/FixJ family response regulator
MPPKIKILLVDDHHLFSDGITGLLQSEGSFQVVGQVYDGNHVLPTVHQKSPDLILLDANLPNVSGKDLAEKIKANFPKIKIMVLTMYDESQLVREFQKIGVEGYLLKNSTKNELLSAIFRIMEGETVFDGKLSPVSSVQAFAGDEFQKRYLLTPRELEILRLIRKGHSSQAIADLTSLSLMTVKTHRRNIHFKLKTETTADLIRFAMENNL